MASTNTIQHYSTDLIPGMDIQTTIQKIQDVKKQAVTTAQTDEKTIKQQISDWGDVSSSISTLTDSLDALRSYDTWSKMNVTSSNTTAVSATANASAEIKTYAVQVTHLAQSHTVASNTTAALGVSSSTDDLIAAGTLTAGQTFTIEGQTFTVGTDEYGVTDGGKETITSLMKKINGAASGMTNKVTASIIDNRLVLTRVATGSSQINMSDPGVGGGAAPLQTLGFLNADETFNSANVIQQAQNAQFSVNGLSVTRASNTNLTDVIQNVTLSLGAETSIPVTLAIAHDTIAPTTAIQSFVTNYNAAVAKLLSYSSVTLNGDSAPTVGDLQGDSMIPTMLSQLRSMATATKTAFFPDASYSFNGKTGNMVSLQDIGVWTTGKENQLSVIDSTRLDQMLANNFSKVQQLFQGLPTSKGYVHGVASDLYNYAYQLSTPMSGDIAKHVFVIQKSDNDALAHIKTMQDDIARQEQDLWAQFSSVQSSIQQMKADTSWLGTGSSSSSSSGG